MDTSTALTTGTDIPLKQNKTAKNNTNFFFITFSNQFEMRPNLAVLSPPAQFTRCGGRTLSELATCRAVAPRRRMARSSRVLLHPSVAGANQSELNGAPGVSDMAGGQGSRPGGSV
jgi:hypothetical protein